jgi:hypothetical protein
MHNIICHGFDQGILNGGSITVLLTSCLTVWISLFYKKIVRCHTADSKPVKQEVKGTVILPPLVFHSLILVDKLEYFKNAASYIFIGTTKI